MDTEPISRRDMLAKTTLAGTTLAAGLSVARVEAQTQAQAALDAKLKLKVIVTGGHPGDPEYGCGGTAARYSDLGHEVVLLYLNEGDPAGKPAPPKPRRPESSIVFNTLSRSRRCSMQSRNTA